MATAQRIHLIVEKRNGDPRWNGAIVIGEDAQAVHVALDANGAPKRAASAEGAVLGATVLPGSTPRLALAPLASHIRINGHPAPPIAVLRSGDEIDIGDDWRLHLTLYRSQPVVLTGPDLIGRECPVCLSRLEANQPTFVCGCGTAMHIVEHNRVGELDCANAAGECPNCRHKIDLRAGYESLPEEYCAVVAV